VINVVKVGMGVEGPYGQFTIPLYGNGERSVITIDPLAVNLGDYKLELSLAITAEDISGAYRRLTP